MRVTGLLIGLLEGTEAIAMRPLQCKYSIPLSFAIAGCLVLALAISSMFDGSAASDASEGFRGRLYEYVYTWAPDQAWVGSGEDLLVTRDGGQSWTNVMSIPDHELGYKALYRMRGLSGHLWSVEVANGHRVTTDGGQTWTTWPRGDQLTSSTDAWSVDRVPASNAAGWADTPYHTRDAGRTWEHVPIPGRDSSETHIHRMVFISPRVGFVKFLFGHFYRTQDGGQNWERRGEGPFVDMVFFVDSETGWAVAARLPSAPQIYWTRDGGLTWTSGLLPSLPSPPSLWSSTKVSDLFFLDAHSGWAVCITGEILHTSDGGKTWQLQASGTKNYLTGISFSDTQHGWAVGAQGTILKTSDGGRMWTRVADDLRSRRPPLQAGADEPIRTETAKQRDPSATALPAAVPSPPTPASGALIIQGTPIGTRVFLDDQEQSGIGDGPLRLAANPGGHILRFEAPGFRPRRAFVDVIVSTEHRVTFALSRLGDTRRAGIVQRRGTDRAEMVYIPAGTFEVHQVHGSGLLEEEGPAHPVPMAAFWLDKTEVTNTQFAEFVQAGNAAQGRWQDVAPGKDQHPVVHVTWADAVAYCKWADKRLPTQTEWEYAARGTDDRKYPWGNDWGVNRVRFSVLRGDQSTDPVGSYPCGASPFGVQDLAGNVSEWTSSDPYADLKNLPAGAAARVARGASWHDGNAGEFYHLAVRRVVPPQAHLPHLGFRCAQDDVAVEPAVQDHVEGDAPVPQPPSPDLDDQPARLLGTLAVSATLPGVEVWVEGDWIGATRGDDAALITTLPAGAHCVRGVKAGFKLWERTIQVAANQQVDARVDLDPARTLRFIRSEADVELVPIPGGTFEMGTGPEDIDHITRRCAEYGVSEAVCKDWYQNEFPRHTVSIAPFLLDKTEVTNAQFARFIAAGNAARGHWREEFGRDPGREAPGKDQHPVVNVTWDDAVAYCRWASKRLPSEAEWEYAARGSDRREYPWGNAWHDSRARFGARRGDESTDPVGSYPSGASPFGVLDLAGNVSEWTSSLAKPYPYIASDGREDLSAPGERAIRGGSWYWQPWEMRSAFRYWSSNPTTYFNVGLGFRCARTAH